MVNMVKLLLDRFVAFLTMITMIRLSFMSLLPLLVVNILKIIDLKFSQQLYWLALMEDNLYLSYSDCTKVKYHVQNVSN